MNTKSDDNERVILAGNVIAHHAGIEDKGEIMHRIEVQIQTAAETLLKKKTGRTIRTRRGGAD